jgi:thymidylate synthase (FAD)
MMGLAERTYQNMLRTMRPEQARDVLPNATKTAIVIMANVREWRHVLTLRTSPQAHPQMRALMLPLLEELTEKYPVLFGDIKP